MLITHSASLKTAKKNLFAVFAVLVVQIPDQLLSSAPVLQMAEQLPSYRPKLDSEKKAFFGVSNAFRLRN
jgi:hypothetical protein